MKGGEGLAEQKENNFHWRCHVQNKVYNLIDSSSCIIVASMNLVDKLNLQVTKHLVPCKQEFVYNGWVIVEMKVHKQILSSIFIGKYHGEVLCDIDVFCDVVLMC